MKRILLASAAVLLFSGAALAQTPAAPAPAQDATKDAAKDQKADKPKWDVRAAAGYDRTLKLDVREGSWMALDVSPDGKEVVFDLMGDIYVLPIGGGEARNIASGISWDMQPTWSPDGKQIAFTSDRGGGDNIWVMDRDGSNPKAVSSESFRLLSQPAWTPDGQYIVGRKHFTSGRSLGAGEMWLFHRSGGNGVQLTERRTQQKDSGEPAFSPDGRYLYFSDDVTAGGVFEYSKDPNTDLCHSAAGPRDGRDQQVPRRSRRRDPPDALAGRQVARLHPAGSLPVGAVCDGHRLGPRDADP